MSFIWSYLRPFKRQLLFIFLGMVMFTLVTLGLPTVLAYIIDDVIIPKNYEQLAIYLTIMVLITLLGVLGQLFGAYFISQVTTLVVKNIRDAIYEKMQHLSHHEFQTFGVPSLTNRITTDAFIIMQFVQLGLRTLSTAPIMILISMIMVGRTASTLGLYLFPVMPLIIGLIYFIARLTLPISKKQQVTLDKMNQLLRENILGTRVIRAYNREGFMTNRFQKVNSSYQGFSIKLFKTMAVTPALFSFIVNLTIITILILGSHLIAQQKMQVGTLVAFIEYVWQALFSLMVFANIFMMYPRAMVSAHRLKEVLYSPISITNPSQPLFETNQSGQLEFRHVYFSYPDADEPVLEDLSFTTKAGQTLAFIGSTGSGKSTIVKLIPRFYDVTSGQILLDGIDIRRLDLKTLRSKIGYTPQTANLFSGQIAANLRFGKPTADEKDMTRATEVSQAFEFISNLDSGYKTHLTEGGTNLSGGQRQRLSIARSIIGKREIYIFDDSFSALDYKTDAKVRQALREETQEATTLIIAQRVGTIINADKIIVLDKGKIIAQGTHQELLASCPLYYEIAASQLTKEELHHES
ncbi:ABC transporter ATP-binding protein [Aerococcus christensenii]|uniref:ABC transporter ATP-binding protein n=1 Tax=Aerococcus christensenii TaxID=87541 RepID=A0A120I8U6_9LACT|nr:ABC transporter ATP-binding protein [Aerococcus christensenii]AMB92873.1 multidrug ABC transporter ATP-binding protein [Aerococcus christensenii]PKY91626.1 ABC transporter ATP-binding protein [Aerococcus christensenii]